MTSIKVPISGETRHPTDLTKIELLVIELLFSWVNNVSLLSVVLLLVTNVMLSRCYFFARKTSFKWKTNIINRGMKSTKKSKSVPASKLPKLEDFFRAKSKIVTARNEILKTLKIVTKVVICLESTTAFFCKALIARNKGTTETTMPRVRIRKRQPVTTLWSGFLAIIN